jgi:predicted dehydrogenase
VEIVLNLNNPESHCAMTRAALEAGKHVYAEKLLAMSLDGAAAWVDIARYYRESR